MMFSDGKHVPPSSFAIEAELFSLESEEDSDNPFASPRLIDQERGVASLGQRLETLPINPYLYRQSRWRMVLFFAAITLLGLGILCATSCGQLSGGILTQDPFLQTVGTIGALVAIFSGISALAAGASLLNARARMSLHEYGLRLPQRPDPIVIWDDVVALHWVNPPRVTGTDDRRRRRGGTDAVPVFLLGLSSATSVAFLCPPDSPHEALARRLWDEVVPTHVPRVATTGLHDVNSVLSSSPSGQNLS